MTEGWLYVLADKVPLDILDYIILSFNLLVFLFARFIIAHSPKGKKTPQRATEYLASE